MQSTLIVALLCAMFVATHIGLASDGVRAWMIGRLGESRWVWAYLIVAAVLFSLIVTYYAGHQFDGPPGPCLGAVPAMRWGLIAVSVAGITLMGSTFARYFNSPYAVFAHNFREPYGIERITTASAFCGHCHVRHCPRAALVASQWSHRLFVIGYPRRSRRTPSGCETSPARRRSLPALS